MAGKSIRQQNSKVQKLLDSGAMKRIEPTAIYKTAELQNLLKGFVSLETLRVYGLVGSPGQGYWGQNVVDAINNYWYDLVRQRGTGKVRKEDHLDSEDHAFFENGKKPLQGQRPIHPSPGRNKPVESQRERFEREVSEDSILSKQQG